VTTPQQLPAGHRPAASVLAGADVCAASGFRLRPRGHAAMFDDDIWRFDDVDGLSVQLIKANWTRLDFTAITDLRWRLAAKEYMFARLAPGHPVVAVLPNAFRVPLTLATCAKRLTETVRWMNWLTAQNVPSLGDVTQDHCDRYLAERSLRKDATGTVIGTMEASGTRVAAAVVTELVCYGELLSADRYRDGFTPLERPVVLPGCRHAAADGKQDAGRRPGTPAAAAGSRDLRGRHHRPPPDGTSAAGAEAAPGTRPAQRSGPAPRPDRAGSASPCRYGRAAGSDAGRRHHDPPAPGVEPGRPASEGQLQGACPRGRHWQDPPGGDCRGETPDRADPHAGRDRQAVGPPRRARAARRRNRNRPVDAPARRARHPRPSRLHAHRMPPAHRRADRNAPERTDGTAPRMPHHHPPRRRHDPLPPSATWSSSRSWPCPGSPPSTTRSPASAARPPRPQPATSAASPPASRLPGGSAPASQETR
jgi:hypothetical protein